jgi:hypothetical protein
MQELLPIKLLEKLAEESGADKNTVKFTVMRHMNTLLHAQLMEKNGLRAIEAGLKADKKLQEYTGTISYSQISRASRDQDSEIFKAVFEAVYAELNRIDGVRKIPLNYGVLKVLDSTAVQLCLKLFPWAKYRTNKGAIKIHTLYDVLNDCPEKILLTEGIVHDKTKMEDFITIAGVTYLFDRAYLDHKEFDRYCNEGIYFVSRLKKNAVFEVLEHRPIMEGSKVLSDVTVILGGPNARMKNPVRLVKVIDSSNGEEFYIVTNRFDLTADEIADMYRLRWSIEVFFKWIKQHLKIKHFYGTTFNAILIQIYSALILYCLLKLVHIIYCRKFDFLEMTRLIVSGIWNTLADLIDNLTPTKPPPKNKRKPFDWKKEYREVLDWYNITDDYC